MPPLHLLVRSGNHGHPGLLHYPTTAFCLSQSHSLLSCRTWTPKFSSRLRCDFNRQKFIPRVTKEKWYAHVQSLKTNIMALFVHFILVPPLSIYRGELSFLQPVHFCICWRDSAVIFFDNGRCVCVFLLIGKIMSWESAHGDISIVHSRRYTAGE